MELTSRFTTRTYFVKTDIFIDIVCDDVQKKYDAYMYDINFGVKFFMIGVRHETLSFYGFMQFIESDINLYLAILENEISKKKEVAE